MLVIVGGSAFEKKLKLVMFEPVMKDTVQKSTRSAAGSSSTGSDSIVKTLSPNPILEGREASREVWLELCAMVCCLCPKEMMHFLPPPSAMTHDDLPNGLCCLKTTTG